MGAPIHMPKLGLTMTEGMVVEWCIAPGERISKGATLVIVETDKIANEVAADRDGTLGTIVVEAGATVPVGAVLAHWLDAASELEVTATAPVAEVSALPVEVVAPGPAVPRATDHRRVISSPHARKVARELGLDLLTVTGSGPGGRIKADDVRRQATQVATPRATVRAVVRNRQAVVGQRMLQSKREIPHFYLTARADVSELDALHRRLHAIGGYRGLTLTHWLVAAAGMVLARTPRLRAVWRDDRAVLQDDTDIAIAVALEEGLVAPVVREAGRLDLAACVHAVNDLVERARSEALQASDIGGGSLCISNLGAYDIDFVLPIIVPGQSAILGVGRTHGVFRPDAHGQPVLKQELGLALACDHRVYNGTDGAALLTQIVKTLEDPVRILAATRGHE